MIISFYAKGVSVTYIEEQIKEMYDFEVAISTISRITNALASEAVAWQNRTLENLYLIVWMDGIVFKVRENVKVINKTIYLTVGFNREGRRQVLGIWLGKKESSFWRSVLTDLKAREVEGILITATNNLNGFRAAIRSIFPQKYIYTAVNRQSIWS